MHGAHFFLIVSSQRVYGPWFFCLFGVSRVMPAQVVNLLTSWMGAFRTSCQAVGWGVVPLCIMWVIWRERNQRVFEGIERPLVSS